MSSAMRCHVCSGWSYKPGRGLHWEGFVGFNWYFLAFLGRPLQCNLLGEGTRPICVPPGGGSWHMFSLVPSCSGHAISAGASGKSLTYGYHLDIVGTKLDPIKETNGSYWMIYKVLQHFGKKLYRFPLKNGFSCLCHCISVWDWLMIV